MKIILIKDVSGVGKRGDVKEVSEGYASNFLIPKGFAQVVSQQLQAKLAKEAQEAAAKHQKELVRLQLLKIEMEKRTFTVKVKVGDKGQVFGSVHEKDIAKVIGEKMNLAMEKNQIELVAPIKTLGIHQIKIKLGSGTLATTKINLEPLA
jgi:large subunit ribosomal protein L9